MGKAKKSSHRGPRHNPVGIDIVSAVEDDEQEPGVSPTKCEGLIQTVIDQLQSPSNDDKLSGLHLLADVFDGRALTEVVRNKVVRIAGPLLLDPCPTVRNSTSGALRNLTVSGGPEFCDILIEQDVMTPLCALIKKFGDSWLPKTPGSSENDENADTFIQAVNILWNLCESNATAVKYFNQAHLLPLLMRCLDINTFGINLAITVAECLHTVTEDNQEAVSEMQEMGTLLQQFLSRESDDVEIILLKVLVSGILLNIHQGPVSSMDPSLLRLIMASLSSALQYDQRRALNQLTSDLELNINKQNPRSKVKKGDMDEEMASENEDENEQESKPPVSQKTRGKSSHKAEKTVDSIKEEQKLISKVAKLLEAQQVALEILANLCSGDDDDESMDAEDSDSEEMSDSSYGEEAGSQETTLVSVSPDVLEAVVSMQLITKVWDKTVLPAENVWEILSEHQDCQTIFNRINLLRSRAFLCLQNMLAVMDLEEMGGCNDLYNMWLETTKLVFEKTKADDVQLLEAATSVMRATVLRLAQAKATQFASLGAGDLQILLNGESQCKDANVRANLIRIVSCIGQMLIPVGSHLLPVIGKFLLDAASRDAELWVTAEALDCIFDVFGEDETDKVAYDIDLVHKLRGLAPTLKSKVRMQRKNLGDHYHVVMTASTNLNRFISYKSKRLTKLSLNGHS